MKPSFVSVTTVIVILISNASARPAELSTENQAKLTKNVDSYASRMSEVALKIWSAPELGYQETKTSALLQEELKKAGFKIEAGVAGIPTAFVARAGTSDGPVIALLAEIDALPGMSQAATPERKPIPNQIAVMPVAIICSVRDRLLQRSRSKIGWPRPGQRAKSASMGLPRRKAAVARSIWFVPVSSKTWM